MDNSDDRGTNVLFEDVGREVWRSVVYCGCITSGLIPSGWGISPFFP